LTLSWASKIWLSVARANSTTWDRVNLISFSPVSLASALNGEKMRKYPMQTKRGMKIFLFLLNPRYVMIDHHLIGGNKFGIGIILKDKFTYLN
jgi:hypothetical protein